jgi:lysophospholipase L1-like esterase
MDNMKLAIILGGTNDLGHHTRSEDILSNLIRMHEIVHKSNSAHKTSPLTQVLTIAVGIPQVQWPIEEAHRLMVNKGLREYAARCSHLVWYRDVESVFDQKDTSKKHLWSDDMVHLSSEGYDLMGNLLYSDIVDFAYRLSLPVGEEGSLKSDKKFVMC